MRRAILLAALAAGMVLTSTAHAEAPIGQAGKLVAVGPGAAEAQIRQAVRTPAGRVYIVAADDDGGPYQNSPGARLRMYRADQTGIPTSFTEADAANAPSVSDSQTKPTISGGDARLDRNGVIHVSYLRNDTGQAVYQTFSTLTDTWGPPEAVTTVDGVVPPNIGIRGLTLTALAIDAQGAPFVGVTTPLADVTVYRRVAPGSWSAEIVASVPGSYNAHPSMTFDRLGRLDMAWFSQVAATRSIRLARRGASGIWEQPQIVASGDVLGQDAHLFDQGPSVAVNASQEPVVLYLNDSERVRLREWGGSGWSADDPVNPEVYAHTPGLHLRGNDRFVLLGHDAAIHSAYLSRAAAASAWSASYVFPNPAGSMSYLYDGSANSRFDPLYDPDCNILDALFFDEDSDTKGGFKPDLYYAGVQLPQISCSAGGDGGGGGGDGGVGGGNGNGSGGSDQDGGCGNACGASGDTSAPKLSRVGLSRVSFHRADRRVRLRYRLSEAAQVSVTVRRRERACARTERRRHPCRWGPPFVTRRVSSRSGAKSIRLSRILGRSLRVGRYELALEATDAAGNRSAPRRLSFSLLPGPPAQR